MSRTTCFSRHRARNHIKVQRYVLDTYEYN